MDTIESSQKELRQDIFKSIQYSSSPTRLRKSIKRTIDFLGALVGLVLVAPILLIVAAAIKMSSKGPLLFTQERVGEGGRLFKMKKFRSMNQNADQLKSELKSEQDGPAFKMKNDPRVTPVGRFIRKHSIDELPQLLNVLKGDLSLVGPRPALMNEVKEWKPHYFKRLAVPQGLTCLWQANSRNNTSFENWMNLDIQYVEHSSIRLDIKLIIKTVGVVIRGTGS